MPKRRDTKRLQINKTEIIVGFTLVELLVVVGIIGILVGIIATFTVPNVFQAGGRARDAHRKNHIRTLTQAIINYNFDNGCYPTQQLWDDAECSDTEVPPEFLSPYINTFACDPSTGEKYTYQTTDLLGYPCEGDCGECESFRLLAHLENHKDKDIIKVGCHPELGCGVINPAGKNPNWGLGMNHGVAIPDFDPNATPTPTEVPLPTPPAGGTPTQAPTNTPIPTNTPLPTNTPTPDNTPTPAVGEWLYSGHDLVYDKARTLDEIWLTVTGNTIHVLPEGTTIKLEGWDFILTTGVAHAPRYGLFNTLLHIDPPIPADPANRIPAGTRIFYNTAGYEPFDPPEYTPEPGYVDSGQYIERCLDRWTAISNLQTNGDARSTLPVGTQFMLEGHDQVFTVTTLQYPRYTWEGTSTGVSFSPSIPATRVFADPGTEADHFRWGTKIYKFVP